MEPIAWAVFAENGNIRIWSPTNEAVEKMAAREGLAVTPLYTAPEWRDVGTLPKIDPDTCRSNDLLGCWANGSMMVVYLDVCNGWMDSEGGEGCIAMPTHWQPLPEPPPTESV